MAEAARAQGIPEERIRELIGEVAAPETGTEELQTEPDIPEVVPDRVEMAPPEVVPSEEEAEPLPFGYSLFETSPESYRQPAFGPVDPEYPLGPGDGIVLDVWGDTVFRLERELDREGGVNLPDIGRVVLAGMTLEEVRQVLRRRLSTVYSGLAADDRNATTHLSVTLGNLRVIRVFVVGRARRPGGYDLSAASTVFHALFFAGGPTLSGSLRDIRVVRGGREVAHLDVYEYLRSGRRDGDIRLENDDTVFVPPTGPRVLVEGAVREPGVYEVIPGETLAELVRSAGGFTERAFRGRIHVGRFLTDLEQQGAQEDRKVVDVSFDEQAASFPMRDGDTVTVFEINDRVRNYVVVRGEVRRPGTYEYRDGSHLSELLRGAGGLLETAFLERAELVRTYVDQRREQIAVDLREVFAGEPERNILVQPRDEITVHSMLSMRDSLEVSLYGAVRAPGRYELRENMTLRDLMLQAGGVLDHAYLDDVEVSRVSPDENEGLARAEIFHVPLEKDYLSTSGTDFLLKPYDNIFVREKPNYELQRNVVVRGEVRFPGTYTLTSPRETLAEVIDRAGGLKETAYPQGFQFVREKDGLGRVAIDLGQALRNPRSHDNIALFGGDSLYVPEEPKTVTVEGEVGFPTSLLYEPGRSITDYVDRAGGTTDKADKGRIRIVYTTGAAARVKKLWFDPEVLPGSTIIVPRKDEDAGVDWGNVIRDTTSILASLATVVLVIDNVSKN
jgi:protein involved in polysaccharide export with SLBB domain